jgi:hypothetical protein
MSSDVDIASLALGLIGSQPITSLDPPDNTERAKTVALWYDEARDAVLRAHPWKFATERVELANDPVAPVWQFLRRFKLPNDNLRCLECDGQDRSTNKWVVEKGYVLTDLASPLKIKYIQKITDSETWDAVFVQAMTHHLASLIAEKLAGSTKQVEIQTNLFNQKIAMARSIDGFEQTDFDTDDTNLYSWLYVRI